MGIPFEKSLVVDAPAAAVWELLTDPVRVASCLPGAAITGKEDDRTWAGTMTVKVGPVTASYRGKIHFERLDPAAREAEIAASGQETRGKGGADMRMRSRVVERGPAETEVTIVSDVNVVGVLAQFGRGMIQDVSDQLFIKFTDAMRRQLAAATAEAAASPGAAAAGSGLSGGAARHGAGTPPGSEGRFEAGGPPAARSAAPSPAAEENVLDAGALGTAALGRAAARTLRRPELWIAAALVVLIVCWLASR
jgi:carbon monoxide dehydrogenase subunit G